MDDQRAQWDLTGVSDAEYELDRPLPCGGWYRPRSVECAGEDLRYAYFDPQHFGTFEARAGGDMLGGFVELAAASADRITRYARRWGVLGVCAHGLPNSHRSETYYELGVGPTTSPCPLRYDDGWYFESVSAWRRLAREARSILNIAAAFERGQPGAEEDWANVPEYLDSPIEGLDDDERWRPSYWKPPLAVANGDLARRHGLPGSPLEMARSKYGRCLNRWLRWGRVGVAVDLSLGRSVMKLSTPSLFSALALQLFVQAGRERPMAFCSNCHEQYEPRRRPNPNRRNYCPKDECRKRAAKRDAKREERRRSKENSDNA